MVQPGSDDNKVPVRARLAAALLGMLSVLGAAAAVAAAQGTAISLGVVLPSAQLAEGADVAETLRQSLMQRLSGAGVDVFALPAGEAAQISAEAAAHHATYVLYTHVEQKHGGGIGGMFRKLAPLAGALPMLGGLAHSGGAGMGSALSAVTQSAAAASASASQQALMERMAGVQHSSVKAGDTLTLDYRLVAADSAALVKADRVVLKAHGDGEDLLGPAIEQLAGGVSGVTGVRADPNSAAGERAEIHVASAGGAAMDCEHMPASAASVISPEACRKMMASQQAYTQAASDPRAMRAGDEQMSCAQIAAELHTQSYRAPDRAKVARAQADAAQEQTTLARQQAEVQQTALKEQVVLDSAIASDNATAVATGGLVRPQAAMKVEQQLTQQNRVMGERMARERQPTEQRLYGTTADFAADASQQLTANPRLARLMELANARHCKNM